MRIEIIQMNMKLGDPSSNMDHAEQLIREAAKDRPDVIVLPETWNVGFYPRENLEIQSEGAQERICSRFAPLASELGIHLVLGSCACMEKGSIYNRAMVFDRCGKQIAQYDKTHLFSPMQEDRRFTAGKDLCLFKLDGVSCGIIICYDIRFPELVRKMALQGMELLFVVSQWPNSRLPQLRTLCAARAIENQMFVACCNSCAQAGEVSYGGGSAVYSPIGEILAEGATEETVFYADCDLTQREQLKQKMDVFSDRRPELY